MVRLIPHLARKKTRFIRATYLTPQKVAESYSDWATGDTHQSKVVYNGEYFFVFYWEGGVDLWIKRASSSDGVTWNVAGVIQLTGYDLSPYAGNVDIRLKNNAAFYLIFQYCSAVAWYPYPRRVDVSGTSFTYGTLWSYRVSGNRITTSKLNYNPNGKVYHLVHGSTTTYVVYSPDPYAVGTQNTFSNVPSWSATSGGVQLLNYKTSSPYDMLALIKQGTDDVLYYSLLRGDTELLDTPMTSMDVILASGFSTFCATSEAQAIGDPERVHLVYIKSTGELCYNKYENDALGDEVVLVASGASYPVIAVGKGGKLYVYYVKDGKIKLIMYVGSWHGELEPFKKHTFNTPTYLSTNQNVQHGKICLTWTEGTASPYEVWFAYLTD